MQQGGVVVTRPAENARRREQIADLAAQNAELAARVQELEARLAKDSHTSSKPPVVFSFLISSDSPHRVASEPRARLGEVCGVLEPSGVARNGLWKHTTSPIVRLCGPSGAPPRSGRPAPSPASLTGRSVGPGSGSPPSVAV